MILWRGVSALLPLALGLGLGGCSWVSKIGADVMAGTLSDASDSLRGYFDYETAGYAGANTLLQGEALHGLSPDNEELTMMLAQGYIVYAFGWVMDEYEQADAEGEFDAAERHRQRAYQMYARARDLMKRVVVAREPDIEPFLEGHPEQLRAFLKEEFDDPEDDVGPLFWLSLAWGSAITNAPDMDDFIDMPLVRVVAEHAVSLDETYEHAGGRILLGGYISYPDSLGGDLKQAKQHFERGIELSCRRNHLHLVNFARLYALNAQDRELFVSLLREVIESPDLGADVRMTNKVARRRAERYLARVDDWFP